MKQKPPTESDIRKIIYESAKKLLNEKMCSKFSFFKTCRY